MAEARIAVVIGSVQAQSGANAVRRAVDGAGTGGDATRLGAQGTDTDDVGMMGVLGESVRKQ